MLWFFAIGFGLNFNLRGWPVEILNWSKIYKVNRYNVLQQKKKTKWSNCHFIKENKNQRQWHTNRRRRKTHIDNKTIGKNIFFFIHKFVVLFHSSARQVNQWNKDQKVKQSEKLREKVVNSMNVNDVPKYLQIKTKKTNTKPNRNVEERKRVTKTRICWRKWSIKKKMRIRLHKAIKRKE